MIDANNYKSYLSSMTELLLVNERIFFILNLIGSITLLRTTNAEHLFISNWQF